MSHEILDQQALEKLDREILDIIQTNFPISPRPYKDLAQMLNTSEELVFERIEKLKADKLIRRLGANFQSSKLGFRSTLCAAKVPDDKKDFFIKTVNDITGVTHNYLRKHEFNIWFTLIASSWEKVEETLAQITQKTGIDIINLPAIKLYKIKVDFKLAENQ